MSQAGYESASRAKADFEVQMWVERIPGFSNRADHIATFH